MAKGKVQAIRRDVPDTWETALKDFLFWKQAQELAERTMADYSKHVTQFFTCYPDAFRPDHLKSSILEYMAQPVKPATFNLRLVYLKAFFFRLVSARRHLYREPAQRLQMPEGGGTRC